LSYVATLGERRSFQGISERRNFRDQEMEPRLQQGKEKAIPTRLTLIPFNISRKSQAQKEKLELAPLNDNRGTPRLH
jgi:hypothetical protein